MGWCQRRRLATGLRNWTCRSRLFGTLGTTLARWESFPNSRLNAMLLWAAVTFPVSKNVHSGYIGVGPSTTRVHFSHWECHMSWLWYNCGIHTIPSLNLFFCSPTLRGFSTLFVSVDCCNELSRYRAESVAPQVGGWSQVYTNLTFATVREAGHEVPEYQPGRALQLFKHFLKGQPLPTFNYPT
jgi:hypothetical protein